MDQYQRNHEVDVAVAALPVSCPYFDETLGTACLWSGPLERFEEHEHEFDDTQRPSATESRGTKRRRLEEDADEVDDDDDDVVETPPPSKIFRFLGSRDIHVGTVLGYGLHIDRHGVHVYADGAAVSEEPSGSNSSDPDAVVASARTT